MASPTYLAYSCSVRRFYVDNWALFTPVSWSHRRKEERGDIMKVWHFLQHKDLFGENALAENEFQLQLGIIFCQWHQSSQWSHPCIIRSSILIGQGFYQKLTTDQIIIGDRTASKVLTPNYFSVPKLYPRWEETFDKILKYPSCPWSDHSKQGLWLLGQL